MCGIAGFWGDRTPDEGAAIRMAAVIANRGPDDYGTWSDAENGIALGHRRLSILDLSPAGHQPMCSSCERYTLVFNGEIYNHLDLRTELEEESGAFAWRGHSDTETLLAALRHWGVAGTLDRLNGMFAFALWDGRDKTLFLARDRMGEKPLYYGRNGDSFLFASELKALAAYPHWKVDVDRDALALYLRYGNVPAPWSIYKGISKLPPAHFVAVREQGRSIGTPECYWNLEAIASAGTGSATGEPGDLADELDELLRDSVGRRMLADVPLGAFLSGGYDSTTVVAQMQAQSTQPVRTFSIGFHDQDYNEAVHAGTVATHLGTDHTELYVTAKEAMEVIPDLPQIYDEPFADSSQIPTFLVSRMAREHVKVSLSGDGGDELFGGYNRHVVGPDVWMRSARWPVSVRHGLGRAVGLAARTGRLPGASRIPQLGEKLEKLSGALHAEDGEAFYKHLVSHWKQPDAIVRGGREPDTIVDSMDAGRALPGLRERMMFLDMMTYLPDDILTKVDRASMAVSLEARVPLLDHRLVEFAWRVPTEYKVRDGQGKWLLRQVLYRYVPKEIMDRPKMGFAVPLAEWLRGPLRDWAETLLDADRLKREGYFSSGSIRKAWSQHLKGHNRASQLWCVLMFQAWLEVQAA